MGTLIHYSQQWIDGPDRINREGADLNSTIDQVDLIDIYTAFYPVVAEYIVFSSEHGAFSKLNHVRSQNKP